MDLNHLRLLLNLLRECNVSYYRTPEVELRLGSVSGIPEEEALQRSAEPESEEQVRLRETIKKLPEAYRYLLR